MARDYHAEYEARNELAIERGFDSYSDERKAIELLSTEDGADKFYDAFGTDNWRDEPEGLAAWYNAFFDPVHSEDRSSDSWRAYWFVEITGDIESYEEWEELYGDD